MFVPFVIAYTISYVQISYVHLYAQLTIGRTYFSGILFFSSIKNVVSSISTGVPLKIFQHSLSYSTKPIFLRFIVFFTVHLLKVSNGETETELLWGSWVDQPVYFHVSCDVISCRFSITLFCFMPSSNFLCLYTQQEGWSSIRTSLCWECVDYIDQIMKDSQMYTSSINCADFKHQTANIGCSMIKEET